MKEIKDMEYFNGPLHQSDLSMLSRCERAFMYRYKWGLRPKLESGSGAAGLGQIFHKVVEYGEDRIEESRAWVKKQQQVLWEAVERGEDIDGGIAISVKAMTDAYNKALAVARIYWEQYPTPDYLETLATEEYIEGTVTIGEGVTVRVAGTVDRLMRDKRDGRLWVRDWKTSSRDVEYIMTGYQWSIQCKMYRILAHLWARQNQEIYGIENTEPVGFIVDGVQMPTIKFCKKDRDFDAYIERCKAWYKDNLKTAFVSRAVIYQEPLLNESICKLLAKGSVAQNDTYIRTDKYSNDITASYCTNYERQCTYYDLCNCNERLWPEIIDRKFKVVEPTDNVNTPEGSQGNEGNEGNEGSNEVPAGKKVDKETGEIL